MAAIVSVTWAAVGDGGVVTGYLNKPQDKWRPIDVTAGETCKPGELMLKSYTKAGADAAFVAKGDVSGFLTKAAADGFYLGKNGKAADSDKLDGYDSTDFLGDGAKAADSALLDGKSAADYLLATGKAADSDKLGGIDATGFVRGQGSYQRFAGTVSTRRPPSRFPP